MASGKSEGQTATVVKSAKSLDIAKLKQMKSLELTKLAKDLNVNGI